MRDEAGLSAEEVADGQKTLVFIIGPPAVGKMTVGQELSRLTGLPLFHNHLSIEAVLPVFGFGDPAFNGLVTRLRKDVIEEVARSELPGVIFTYVWAFDAPADREYVEDLRDSKGHDFPLEPHFLLDNTNLSPAEAARRMAEHFGLAIVDGGGG